MKLIKSKNFNNFLFTTFILKLKFYKKKKPIALLKKFSLIKLYVLRKFILFYNLANFLLVIKKELNLVFKHICNKDLLNKINNVQFLNLQFKYFKYFKSSLPLIFNFTSKVLVKNFRNNILYDYNLNNCNNNSLTILFKFSKNKSFHLIYIFLKILVYRILKINYYF